MEPKMTILFIGKKSRTTRHDLLPIYMRVTINSKPFEVSTNRHVRPSEWPAAGGKVRGRSDSANDTNTGLDLIRSRIYEYKKSIIDEGREFNVTALHEKWYGQDRKKRTLMGVVRLSILDLQKLAEKGIYKRSTITKYLTTERHLLNYLIWSSKGSDILLLDLRIRFIENFQFFLKVVNGLSINSSGKHIKNLKKIIRDCVDKDWFDRDPFWGYKVKHTDPKVPHLSAEQLKLLEEKEISLSRLEVVRDIFVFSCYTGFAYVDVANLTSDYVKIGVDENKWLVKPRQKSGICELVPIFHPVMRILTKYKDHQVSERRKMLLPVPSNQKVNAYLKELGDICGIFINLTFHMARHTFASTVALDNGVPFDSFSKMLGHRSIKTIQIYARVSETKISVDTQTLLKKFV